MKKNYYLLFLTAFLVVVLDQITKAVISHYLYTGEIIEVIPGLFNIVFFQNTGAAFGIFRAASPFKTPFLIVVTIAALCFIFFMVRRAQDTLTTFCLSLIAGGAAGNLIDRVRTGSVIDFLDLYAGAYHWPAFNVADSAITVGVLSALLLFSFNGPKGRDKP